MSVICAEVACHCTIAPVLATNVPFALPNSDGLQRSLLSCTLAPSSAIAAWATGWKSRSVAIVTVNTTRRIVEGAKSSVAIVQLQDQVDVVSRLLQVLAATFSGVARNILDHVARQIVKTVLRDVLDGLDGEVLVVAAAFLSTEGGRVGAWRVTRWWASPLV